MKPVVCHVALSGADDTALFFEAHGILRRLRVAPGFDFDKHKRVVVPGDDVDFAVFGAIRRDHNAIAEGTEMIDGHDFSVAAEGEETVEEKREWHNFDLHPARFRLPVSPNGRGLQRIRYCFHGESRLLFINDQRRTNANR